MPKVLIADALSPRAVEIFRARGVEADVATGLDPAELRRRIAGYDGLAVRSATKVTAELLAAADALKVVGRAGIGVDNIDVPAAIERGIVVMNTPYGNAITAAEHTIAMMFALARQIPAADRSTQAGKWEKSRFMGVELIGQDARHHRLRQYRRDRRRPRAGVEDARHRLRSVSVAGTRRRTRRRARLARRASGARRFHHACTRR